MRCPGLPKLNCPLLVRTDFTSDAAWQQVVEEAQASYDDGFHAYIEPISDATFDGLYRGLRGWPSCTLPLRPVSSIAKGGCSLSVRLP